MTWPHLALPNVMTESSELKIACIRYFEIRHFSRDFGIRYGLAKGEISIEKKRGCFL